MDTFGWQGTVNVIRVTMRRLPPEDCDGTATHELRVRVEQDGLPPAQAVSFVHLGMMGGAFDRYWVVLGRAVERALKELDIPHAG